MSMEPGLVSGTVLVTLHSQYTLAVYILVTILHAYVHYITYTCNRHLWGLTRILDRGETLV